MAKITLSRLFEVSKYLTTESGKELKDALVYISEFVEVTVRNLTNGLTFVDNFDVTAKTISVRPDTETVIFAANRKRVKEVVIRRAAHDTYYVVSSFGWKFTTEGEVVITVDFTDKSGTSAPATTDVTLDLLLHFG